MVPYIKVWNIVFLRETKYKSSRPEVFCKKVVPRNVTKFIGKHLCQDLFFNKAAGILESLFNKVASLKTCIFIKKRIQKTCNFIKKETLAQVFFCEFCEFFLLM